MSLVTSSRVLSRRVIKNHVTICRVRSDVSSFLVALVLATRWKFRLVLDMPSSCAGQGPAVAERAGHVVIHRRPLQRHPSLDRSPPAVRPSRGPRRRHGVANVKRAVGKLVGILDTLDIASYVVDLEAAGKRSTLSLIWSLVGWLSPSGVITRRSGSELLVRFVDESLEKILGRSTRAKSAHCTEEDALDQVASSCKDTFKIV